MTAAHDEWQSRMTSAPYEFAKAVRELHDNNPWPEQAALDQAINTLMTELWDRCFSQTEIREAFESAIADMPRYAAGQETRP